MSIREAAELLQVSVQAVYQGARRKCLEARRIKGDLHLKAVDVVAWGREGGRLTKREDYYLD